MSLRSTVDDHNVDVSVVVQVTKSGAPAGFNERSRGAPAGEDFFEVMRVYSEDPGPGVYGITRARRRRTTARGR